MGKDVWGLSPHNSSVLCFPGCDFPFQRALIRSVDTWEPSAASSRGGDTLTGRGIRVDWPLTPPSATSLPLGRKSLSQHIHMHEHTKTHVTYTYKAKPHGYPHILNLSHYSTEPPHQTLWHEAVLRSVYQKVPNLCWHKPSIWGYQRMQTLVQSGKGIFAPVQRTHRCRQLQRWKGLKKHAKWCVPVVLYLPVLILSGFGARSSCMFLHPHEETLSNKLLFQLFIFNLYLFFSPSLSVFLTVSCWFFSVCTLCS